MDTNLVPRIDNLEAKIDQIWLSVEKTRKYFQITMWVTVVLFVLPLVLLMFAVPAVFDSYLGSMDGSQLDLLNDL